MKKGAITDSLSNYNSKSNTSTNGSKCGIWTISVLNLLFRCILSILSYSSKFSIADIALSNLRKPN